MKRFVHWQLCGSWMFPFVTIERLTLTLNHIHFVERAQQSYCSAFRHSWIPTQGIFELLNLLLCITVYLEHVHAAFVQRKNSSFFVSIMIPTWLHTSENRPYEGWRFCYDNFKICTKWSLNSKGIFLKTSNTETFLHSVVTVYQIHKDYENKWWKNTHLSESNTHAGRLKFITANIETNPDQE